MGVDHIVKKGNGEATLSTTAVRVLRRVSDGAVHVDEHSRDALGRLRIVKAHDEDTGGSITETVNWLVRNRYVKAMKDGTTRVTDLGRTYLVPLNRGRSWTSGTH